MKNAEIATHFDGISFPQMSDEFLVQTFDLLCERTAANVPYPDDWLAEWSACRDELMTRLRKAAEVAV